MPPLSRGRGRDPPGPYRTQKTPKRGGKFHPALRGGNPIVRCESYNGGPMIEPYFFTSKMALSIVGLTSTLEKVIGAGSMLFSMVIGMTMPSGSF